jgi:hypothetical protein
MKPPIFSSAVVRIGVKALILLTILNFVFAALNPLPALGRLSLYNDLLPGRLRLPYGDNPDKAYNLSLFNLDAMFASHELAGRPVPAPQEYRVILIGDSSVWGFLLPADQTLSAAINRLNLTTADGRRVHAYNLGYPVMSLTKDLLILEQVMAYRPDLIVWPVTLESFPADKQLFPPLLQHNPQPVRRLIQNYGLNLDSDDPSLAQTGFLETTLIGQRRALADLVRLQLYGVMWAATGIDQDIPAKYTPRQEDLDASDDFHGQRPPTLDASRLAFDALEAGLRLAGSTPVLIINEPMFISRGRNSELRYNFFYPRWAYDQYRTQLQAWQTVDPARRRVLDAWGRIDPAEFTNSAVHMTPAGTAQFAEFIGQTIQSQAAKP